MIEQLLPLPKADVTAKSHSWDYIYEPDPTVILDELLSRYVESQVYQGVVENAASEQAARMVAMKAATDNAGILMDDLQVGLQQSASSSYYPGTERNRRAVPLPFKA